MCERKTVRGFGNLPVVVLLGECYLLVFVVLLNNGEREGLDLP